jgi:hypothetical protein
MLVKSFHQNQVQRMLGCGAKVHLVPTTQAQASLFSIDHLTVLMRILPGGGIIELELIAMHPRSASTAIHGWSRP